mmetsp:Transcript_8614/g.25881  ORF Transcript_8614/g.25881 Transcript_8614/m.25881 type:complete len:758 (+) Transcript_8614:498-2771(+)
MWFFYAFSLPMLVGGILYMLRFMPAPDTHWAVKLDVGLAWFAALSTLVLVPTDVATTLEDEPAALLWLWWRIVYWYGFIGQFVWLPIHQEYVDSGHFTWGDRLSSALRNNLVLYAVLGCLGALGICVLLVVGHLTLENIVGICIASSNAFGLIAGIFLMGYGLVAIPRTLWRLADVRGRHRLTCHKAGIQAQKALDAHKQLTVEVATAHKVAGMFGRRDPMRKYMDKITALADDLGSETAPGAVELPDDVDLDYFDRHDLGRLRRRLRTAVQRFRRERELYLELVLSYIDVEDVMRNSERGPGPFQSSTAPRAELLPAWAATLQWWWRCRLSKWVIRGLAMVTAALSVAVVLAEATISPALPNLSVFSRGLHALQGSQTWTEIFCCLSLIYPIAAAYYGLYKMGQFSFYLLVPRHTPAYSLLANAALCCRFGPPLAFNFMAAIAMPPSPAHSWRDVTDSVFYREFGAIMMKAPVIGLEFTRYLPVVIVPYALLQVFGVFNSLLGAVVKNSRIEFDDDWEEKSNVAATGSRLLRQEAANHAAGQPLGATIRVDAGGEGGSVLGTGRQGSTSKWWRPGNRQAGTQVQRGDAALAVADAARANRAPGVQSAYDRLQREARGSPDRSSSASGPPSIAAPPARPNGSILPRPSSRGLGGAGGGGGRGGSSGALHDEEAEDTPLFGGGAGSGGGNLDSIFARLENPSVRAVSGGHVRSGSYSAVPPAASLSVESDGDGDSEPGGGGGGGGRGSGFGGWFRRGR